MYPSKKLSEICIINPKKSEVSKLNEDTLVSFVPMRDMKEGEKYFIPSESKKLSEVYSGYTYFNDEDVLLAKVTPCFENGKSGIAKNLENGIGFGSSEYYVFRCNSIILPDYLYRVISSNKFLKEGAENMSGAVGLKRVTKDFVENFEIPLPPLSIQSRIVAKLDEAFGNIDKQIELLKDNIEDVENMRKSVLSGVFSSDDVSKHNQKMGDFVEFTGGSQPPKSEFIYEEKDGYIRLIQIRDYKSDKHIVYVSKKSVTKFCDKDDIMVGRYGPPIFQILRGIDGAYNVALMRAKFDRSIILGDFLFWFLNNPDIQEYIISLSQRAAGQTGVNKTALESYPIPILPIDKQIEIISYIDQTSEKSKSLKSEYEAQIRDLEIMKQSLLEEAFAGRPAGE